jgi:hypothetical protein
MHSPGEISQIANIFDNRMFEEGNNESNIEFHIHAFLTPPAGSGSAVGSSNVVPTAVNPTNV